MNWKNLDQDHEKGIGHDDGICAWCDYVRQLGKDGYYDFLQTKDIGGL